jgi:tRNA threonylcarbamoyladenosine biosynthesis protein TsaB
MNTILIIDTVSNMGQVALSHGNKIQHSNRWNNVLNHAEKIGPALQDLLAKTTQPPQAIAVVNGPGSYTGLRMGLSVAKGIAYVHSIPILLINTLDALYQTYTTQNLQASSQAIICAIDARRSEVFYNAYTPSSSKAEHATTAILPSSQITEWAMQYPNLHIVGSGARKIAETLQSVPHTLNPTEDICLNTLAQIASQMYQQQQGTSAHQAAPFYIKDVYINS